MVATNKNFRMAKMNKNDEHYTRLPDVANEVQYYKDYFRGKVVYCNCDKHEESHFWHFFATNFKELGLKRLISTYYDKKERPKRVECLYENGEFVGYVYTLSGNGDFRSPECVETLKKADVVVTNPPFSLFRDFVNLMMEHNKNFLIIGSANAVSYKDMFQYIKDGRVWLGETMPKEFIEPNGMIKEFHNIVWYTNIQSSGSRKLWEPSALYDPEKYNKYDGYDIIDVPRTRNIPADYDGVMGVPITYLTKHDPEKYEILGIANHVRWIGWECKTVVNGKNTYNRLLIRKKT